MKKFFKNLAMACLAALSCVAIGLGTGCEAVNSVLGTFESLGGHIGNVIDKVTHECEYNVMKHDADNHWNECECGEKDETSVAAHVYDNACDTTCNVCGAERKVADHVYDNACDKTCNVCGAERKVADHVYDNACDADCNVCGATRTPADHVYDNACDADCNVCGATRTPADHVYDNACDTTCNVCGAERAITHDYSKYASDETNHWKVCSVCGVKDESTVEAHTGGEATATEQAICDVCKAPYGETLPYVTAALTLDGDATKVTIPAGKYAQVSVNTKYGTIVLEFSENVTVTVDGEEVENGAVVEYNVRLGTSIVVTPVDATAETVATIKASTYVDPATILSVGENNVTVNGEQAFVLDIEVGKAYDLTIDYTLYVVAEYSNGVTDSYVVTGYLLKLEEGVSVKLLVSSNDWDSPEASGTITISEHTTHTYVWMKDLNNHWQGCGCGVVDDGTKAAHTYDYECSDTCNVCNAYRFDAADHDYTVAGHDKDGHWKECVCGTRDYSSYEAHYGGTATDSEQAVCEGCGESYGDTLTTAFKDLRIDFPYGLIQLTVPAGKTLDVNLLIEENAYLKITFEGDVTVMFGRQPVASGDVIEVSNVMHTLTVIANDKTVDTVVKMNADTFVVKNGELVLGENEVEAIASPELEFVFTAEEANTYTITADDTLWLYLKTENGSETVDSGYTFTLEAGASITFIIIPSDWNSQATGKVTIAVKTAEEHTHDYTILKSDATGHWYVCSCGEVKADSKVAHSGGTATCTAQAVCEVCGKAYGELAAHTPAADDGDCTTAVKCTVCDAVVVEAKASHTGGTATYTKKAVCEVCGTAYGSVVIPQTQAEIVDAAYSLAKGETLTSGTYTLTGVITEVKYSYTSSNGISVNIEVEGKTIYCYKMKGTGADLIAANDTITVTGTLKNYNGTVEFDPCTLQSYTITDANKVAADAAALKLSAAQLTEVGASIDLAAEGTNGSTITWALKAECANVSLADGKLTVVSLPTEEVEVVLVATLTLNETTTTKELTVIVKAPAQEGEEELAWRLVTDVSKLQAGAKIVIVAANADQAISTNQKSNNRGGTGVTKYADNTVTIDETSVAVLTLEVGKKEGTFALKTEDGKYLYAASSDKNYLRSSKTLDNNASWSITITETGVATIKAQGTNARNWLRYNPNNGSPIFSCYGSGQGDVCIYVYA